MSFASPPPPGGGGSMHYQQQQQQQPPRPGNATMRMPTESQPPPNRSERLQALSQKYAGGTTSNASVSSGTSNSRPQQQPPPGGGGGPPLGGGYVHSSGGAHAGPPRGGPPPQQHGSASSSHHFGASRPTVPPAAGGVGAAAPSAIGSGGPPISTMFGGGHREQAPTPYSVDQSPKRPPPQAVAAGIMSPSSPVMVSKHLAASVTAAAVNSPARSVSQPRRLESSFPAPASSHQGLMMPTSTPFNDAGDSVAASLSRGDSRSKSVPRSRPPPPPPAAARGGAGPPMMPSTLGSGANAEATSKTVSFPGVASPEPASVAFQQKRQASTPYPGKPSGVTPVYTPDDGETEPPSKQHHAGMTPFPTGATTSESMLPASSDSSTSGRRELLRSMREFADTPLKLKEPQEASTAVVGPSANAPPPPATTSVKSPELRLHEQLATTEKEKASALRKVAELQDEITQMRFNSSKQVGFQSPISPSMGGGSSAPRRRVTSTPFPKLRSVLSPDATSPDTVDNDRQHLIEAVECSAFEYDGQGYTFIVRRPYGCEVDQDYWFKAGQHAAKRYAHAADVFRPESIEVAANIMADGSTFTLFGEGEVRHLTATGYSTEYGNVKKDPYIMGNVSYIDNEANDCEYSLEELFQGAMQVRDHYCAAVLSFATALKLKSPNGKSPFVQSPDAHPNVIPNVVDRVPPLVETADKAVETEPMVAPDGGANGDATTAAAATKSDAPKPPSKKGSPSPEEVGSTDLFIAAFSMIIRFVWFILIGLPLRILTTTFVMTMSIVLIAYLWLYLVDDKIAMGPSMHIYSNQAGIL